MASDKRSDGEGSIYRRHRPDCPRPTTARGKSTCACTWQGVLVVGWRDGRPIRKKVSANSETAVKVRLRELRERVDSGALPTDRALTVAEWLTYWLENVASRRNRPSTVRAYGTYVNRYLIPLLGSHRLNRLTPEHLHAAWETLARDGCPGKTEAKPLSSTSVHQAHVILSRALKVAIEYGYATKNVAAVIDAPPVRTAKMQVLTETHAKRVVTVAHGRRNAARWTVAFSLGLRQGEALGLRWSDVDLDDALLRVTHSLGRVKGKGLVLGEVKTAKGVRAIALPAPLVAELREHRAAQNAERLAAGSRWDDGDYVFATEFGKPIDGKADWERWRDLLAEVDVPHVRLHAARHTAITMLLAMGVPPLVVKEMAGHAKFATTEGYVDRVDDLHRDAAERMAAFWA